MPKPRPNETKDAYISRCIPMVMRDGTAKDNKQAYAICSSKYEEAHMTAYERIIKIKKIK